MTVDATNAVYALAPYWPRMLGEIDFGRNMRPSILAIHSVALRLADKFRPERGYTDETVGQLCDALPVDVATVKRSLAALHVLDVWTIERRGGRNAGSRRSPGPELVATARRAGIELVALSRPFQPELVALSRPFLDEPAFDSSRRVPERVATHTRKGRDSATHHQPVSNHQNDDDGPRDSSYTPTNGQSSSSSFPMSLLIDTAARWYARQAGKPGQRPFIAGIARNIRLERIDELNGYQTEGLNLAQALGRMLGSDSAGRVAANGIA